MDLSNCIIDDIKICINDNIGMKSAYLCSNEFSFLNIRIVAFSISSHEQTQ